MSLLKLLIGFLVAQDSEVDELTINSWLDRMLLNVWKEKRMQFSFRLNQIIIMEETFYQHLAKNFGFKINAQPFEMLANLFR